MSKVMRSVRNVTKGYSATQIKVREATSNDPWGPTGTQMSEIAQMTFNTSTEFYDIMDMLDKRLNDKGKNWRHVLKALKVLDYCLHEGSELVVTWARQSVYVIKTLREFQYVDEEGRDVGQNVRVAAKEITSLLLDEERLRAERSDRKSWKSRVTGLEEYAPQQAEGSSSQPRRQQRPTRPGSDEDDAEYRLALEASKHQEEEDRRRREGRGVGGGGGGGGSAAAVVDDDDDLAKAIKLSKEEDERRRRELEETNASSLFDDDLIQTSNQPQPTGNNQGYQQGQSVDFWGGPLSQEQVQPQPTGFVGNAYTGFGQPQQQQQQQPPQPTGFPNYNQTGFDAFGQPAQGFQPQPTGYNPYAAQPLQQQPTQFQNQPIQSPTEPLQSGTNNPWATNNGAQQQQQQAIQPTPTGSNNPFAQFNRPASAKPTFSSLGSLPEQKTLSSFNSQLQQPSQPQQQQPSFGQQSSFGQPQNQLSEHENKLNSLLSSGEGQDTFGNVGNLRIPAQHTAPGTFVNSAGSGVNRLAPEPTGSNPFLRQQFTGFPTANYGAQQPAPTGPASFGGQPNNNPFGVSQPQQQQQQQQQPGQDLIQF